GRSHRTLDVVPPPVAVLLPTPVLIAVDVPIPSCIHISASGLADAGNAFRPSPRDGSTATTAPRDTTGRPCCPIRHTRGRSPLASARPGRRPPAAIHVRALPSLRICARSRIPRLAAASHAVRTPSDGATRVGTRPWVVPSPIPGAAVGTIDG